MLLPLLCNVLELLRCNCCCTVAGKAWQTPLGRYAPQQGGDSVPGGAAWAAVLQLPLEGLLSKGGGVQLVVKRAQGAQPEWLSGPDNKDFFISLDQASNRATVVTHCAHTIHTVACASAKVVCYEWANSVSALSTLVDLRVQCPD